MKTTEKSAAAAESKKWIAMDGAEKRMFVLKVCVMVCTGGFVFANVLAP